MTERELGNRVKSSETK